MRFCKLRIAWSLGCGIACLLLIALWVRSYHRSESFWVLLSGEQLLTIQSLYGELSGGLSLYNPDEFHDSWEIRSSVRNASQPPKNRFQDVPWYRGSYGFGYATSTSLQGAAAPHWFFATATFILTGLPWIGACRRFSLRTLLIATTAVAVVLGAIR
jgi:hypothetical protein